jgi:predicted small lipoprotein YifL
MVFSGMHIKRRYNANVFRHDLTHMCTTMPYSLIKSTLSTLVLSTMLSTAGCGQIGNLYLDDATRIETLEQSPDKTNQKEIQRLQQRQQEYEQLNQEIEQLRQQYAKDKQDASLQKLQEAEYKLGKIALQRQQESTYGNF